MAGITVTRDMLIQSINITTEVELAEAAISSSLNTELVYKTNSSKGINSITVVFDNSISDESAVVITNDLVNAGYLNISFLDHNTKIIIAW